MAALQILHILLLAGSLAFGLEAMLIGLGGQLIVFYRRNRLRMFGLALVSGLIIVGSAVVTSALFGIGEPIYLCVLTLAYTLLAGRIFSLLKPRLRVSPRVPGILRESEEEFKETLRKRGHGELIEKKDKES